MGNGPTAPRPLDGPARGGQTDPPGTFFRIAAGVVVAAGSLVGLVLECFLVPLQAYGVSVPACIVLALLLHPLLSWLMWKSTASRLATLVPAATWAVLFAFLGRPRSEGDAIIAGGSAWVVDGFLLVGALAFAVSLGVLLQQPRPGQTSFR